MTGRGKNGKGAGGGDDFPPSEFVIEVTPDAAFDIRSAAKYYSVMMEESGQDLIIHLPHVSVEFEAGCTPQEIIDGYNQGMRHKFMIKHSNANDKNAPKMK